MVKVSSLVLCECVQPSLNQDANGGVEIRPNIMSPFTNIQPVAVPGNFSFAIFFSLSNIDNIDSTIQNNLQIKIIAPNGDVVFTSAAISIPSDIIPDESFAYSIDFRNFVFTQEGNYNIDIFYNGENIYNYTFSVKQA